MQTYKFQILSVLGDAWNGDVQFRLLSRTIMILLVVVRTVPALASHNGSTDQLTIAELMTEQKPRCLTGAYWLFRMPMVILSLVWLFPPDFLKKPCYRRPRGRQPWILQRRASNILQTISLVKYYTSYYSLWFPWEQAASEHILCKFLYNPFLVEQCGPRAEY